MRLRWRAGESRFAGRDGVPSRPRSRVLDEVAQPRARLECAEIVANDVPRAAFGQDEAEAHVVGVLVSAVGPSLVKASASSILSGVVGHRHQLDPEAVGVEAAPLEMVAGGGEVGGAAAGPGGEGAGDELHGASGRCGACVGGIRAESTDMEGGWTPLVKGGKSFGFSRLESVWKADGKWPYDFGVSGGSDRLVAERGGIGHGCGRRRRRSG